MHHGPWLDPRSDRLTDPVYDRRPPWAVGTIARRDARYLLGRVLRSQADTVIEIGTASGVSTAVLCQALTHARGSRLSADHRVVSYDISPRFYGDQNRLAGDAAREMLPGTLLEHVVFRNPATAADAAKEHRADSVSFAFIDASHSHPWPTLDLLALLPSLTPGGEVALHDINLPRLPNDFDVWGAKYLFDGLDVAKVWDAASDPPNIGSVIVPDDKRAFREQLVAIVGSHAWETDVDDAVTAALLGR